MLPWGVKFWFAAPLVVVLLLVSLFTAPAVAGVTPADVHVVTLGRPLRHGADLTRVPVPPPAPISPTAAPTAVPPVHPTVDRQPIALLPPSAPAGPHSRLTGPHGLDTAIGPAYTDCTGDAPVDRWDAQRDTCFDGSYWIGHNYGVFTPLLAMSPGDVITVWNAAGQPMPYRVTGSVVINRDRGVPPPAPFRAQTCVTADGSRLLIVLAVPA